MLKAEDLIDSEEKERLSGISRDRTVTPELLMFFGRMEAKLDGALQWMQRHEDSATEWEKRIVLLERSSARMAGIAIGASIVISTLSSFISYSLVAGGGQ